jgi:hypothetical protein
MSSRAHDQPDPSLVIEGKRVPKPRNLPDNSSTSAASKKKTHARATSAEEEAASKSATKRQRQREKQARISQFTAAIQKAPAAEGPAPTTSDAPSTPPPRASPEVTATDESQSTATPAPKPVRYHPHRLTYDGRPAVNCAADHPFLRNSDSLAWTFLILTNPVHNEDEDKLMAAKITCSLCVANEISPPQEWDWNRGKWGGSTGNFLRHFKQAHMESWDEAYAKDQAVIKPNALKRTETQATLNSWSKVSCHYSLHSDNTHDKPRCLTMTGSTVYLLSG